MIDPYGAFVERFDDEGSSEGAGPRLAVKDMIGVAGALQPAGLAVRAGRRADEDAAVVRAFRAAGYRIVGVTETDGAGFGTMTDQTANPRHPGRAVGGSSGGSAAAVAASLADLALGTDTGGSVRMPAAYCELAAFKPTAGRTPMEGVMPLSSTFDTVGILAPDLGTIAAAAPYLVPSWATAGTERARFGFLPDEMADADGAVADAFEPVRRRLSAEPLASPAAYKPLAAAHSDIVCAEGLAVHAADWAAHRDGFSQAAAGGLAYAESLTAARIAEARRTVAEAREAFAALMAPDRVLALPTLPMAPLARHAAQAIVAGRTLPATNANIRFTVPFNVAGLPVVVVPVDGLSVQFVGAAGRDEWLLATVRALLASN